MAVPVVVSEDQLQAWADEITRAHGKGIEAILALGTLLLARKAATLHGEWQRMFKGHRQAVPRPAPFSVATALMLMKIAKDPILSNRNLGYALPLSWSTLYQLTFIAAPVLSRLIASGSITPDLRKTEAVMLRYFESAPPHRRMLRKQLARCLRGYADTIEYMRADQVALLRYVDEVNRALTEPGLVWLPPFTAPQPKARPIKILHRCECGHVHEDRRIQPSGQTSRGRVFK